MLGGGGDSCGSVTDIVQCNSLETGWNTLPVSGLVEWDI